MKFTARSNQKEMLGPGKHLVTIASIAECLSKKSDDYKDQTPQLEVKFETENGFITGWYNLKGFKKNEDGSYAINPKTKNRIEDVENTTTAVGIFERLALHAGIPSGTEFDIAELVGMEIGIKTESNDQGKMRVQYTMSSDRVETPASVEAEA